MNVNVHLRLDDVTFYQQKMLLLELCREIENKYGASSDLTDMLYGIVGIFDEIGDQAEAQDDFTYPWQWQTEDGDHFEDERYNDVLKKLIAGKPLEEAL